MKDPRRMPARKSPPALTYYLDLTRTQGDAALQEFLGERKPALNRF